MDFSLKTLLVIFVVCLAAACADDATEATEKPTEAPTDKPTEAPTEKPTEAPTEQPTEAPTDKPTEAPTEKPTEAPTEQPTEAPTDKPTEAPTEKPTEAPTEQPTEAPTEKPTDTPTETPTEKPTETPTEKPTETPTEKPTETPTEKPTETPTEKPTETPTEKPTETPTEKPTQPPTPKPTPRPDFSERCRREHPNALIVIATESDGGCRWNCIAPSVFRPISIHVEKDLSPCGGNTRFACLDGRCRVRDSTDSSVESCKKTLETDKVTAFTMENEECRVECAKEGARRSSWAPIKEGKPCGIKIPFIGQPHCKKGYCTRF